MSIKDLFKIKDFKSTINSLTTENNELRGILDNRDEKIKNLEEIIANYKKKETLHITDYIETKQVDANAFYTNEYKTMFESYLNNEKHTKEEIFNKFNELYNKETIYFEGIVSCIDFIRTKRNKKLSTEKQILKYILTETGRTSLDSYIEAIAIGEDVKNNE